MKFKVGKAYKLRFWDHCMGENKTPVMTETLGWCLEDHEEYAVFTFWRVDNTDTEIVDNNHEPFSVVKSCIKSKRCLKL